MALDIYNGQIQGDLDITGNLIIGGIVPLSTIWTPPNVKVADVASGVVAARNTGCGLYIEFDAAADDEVGWNIPLRNSSLDYDGSDLQIKLYGQIPVLGGDSDTLKFNITYAFISIGDNATTKVTSFTDTISVNGQAANQVFIITLSTLTGSVDAKYLQFSLLRDSTGGGSDTYTNYFRFYEMDILKV